MIIELTCEFFLILFLLLLSGFTLFVFPIILVSLITTYTLPLIILLTYIYLILFETSVYNLPQLLESYLPNFMYTLFLLILYIIYINTCQIYNY